MTVARTPTFHAYICAQAGRDDPVGALSQDAWWRGGWPGNDEYEVGPHAYRSHYGGSPWLLAAFEEAWAEFERERDNFAQSEWWLRQERLREYEQLAEQVDAIFEWEPPDDLPEAV